MSKTILVTLFCCYINLCTFVKGYNNITTDELNFIYNNGSHRTGKFLFDSLFGLELDDVSSNDANVLKSCDCYCGRQNQEVRIVGGRPAGEFFINMAIFR